MKKKYTLFFVFILLFVCELSAQNSKHLKSTEPINTNTAPKPTVDEQEVLKQISQIDSHLLAIETKRNYILSNPTEKALAEEHGWFEQMKKIEKSLLKKKDELKALIND